MARAALAEVVYFLLSSGTLTIALLLIAKDQHASVSGLYPSGAGVGFLLTSRYFIKKHADRARTWMAVGLCLGTVLGVLLCLLLGTDPIIVFLVGVVSGAENVLVGGSASIIYQRGVEEAFAGRIFGFRRAASNLAIAASQVGLPAIAVVIGSRTTLVLSGVATTIVGLCALGRWSSRRPDEQRVGELSGAAEPARSSR